MIFFYQKNHIFFKSYFFYLCVEQWFWNWGPQSFWNPPDNFLGAAKHLPKKSTGCSWRNNFII